jgi:choice-of-anchor B domain-containing protein
MKYCLFLLCTVYQALAFSQSSQNLSLFGQLDPEPIHYAGSWTWTSPIGEEYALVGAFNGTSIVAIDDSTNLNQVAWIPGPPSNWREYTVIGDHAYVVTEGDVGDAGMQVIYLGSLPGSAPQITTFDSTFTKSHIIEKDILGDSNYVYVCGSSPGIGGVHIIDVSDPSAPVEVGIYAPNYAHDCHVRGDTMYVAAISDGFLDIVDISDKANPVRITQIIYPNAFTHSCWTTPDNSHLIVTDEIDGLPAHIYDIRDLSNIVEVATWTANPLSLVHNCYIRGDFGFVAHNTEGLRVLDLRKPDVPVEVGYYDTWSGSSGGFHGLWSACPFLPSGKIIGANRHDGLYVWRFNNTYAGRIYGEVVDSITQLPIVNADIRITQTTDSTSSLTNGSYKFGAVPDGGSNYDIVYSKTGYQTKSINTPLNAQDSLWFRVELAPVAIGIVEEDLAGENAEPAIVPGPGRDELQVEVPAGNESLVLKIFDFQGRRLITPMLMNPGHSRIQLNNQVSGPVIYEFWLGSERVKSGKVMWVD